MRYEVALPNDVQYIDANSISTSDGVLTFYETRCGGRAGPLKNIICAYGRGAWVSVKRLPELSEKRN